MKKSFTFKVVESVLLFLMKPVFRPQVHLEEGATLTLEEPTILVSNHVSHPDGSVIYWLFRRYHVHNLAAKDRFEQGGLMEWYLKNSGCIPIDRKGVSTEFIHESVRMLLQQKESLVIFPEGRHGQNGEILPFHSGVTMIAAMTKATVRMIYIDGKYKAFFGKRCRMRLSAPFHLPEPDNGLTADWVAAQTDALRNRMLSMQAAMKATS